MITQKEYEESVAYTLSAFEKAGIVLTEEEKGVIYYLVLKR